MVRINDRGNQIFNDEEADGHPLFAVEPADYHDRCRYHYDFHEGLEGWRQYDTWQDAAYFGVWVNVARRLIFTYAEGDRSLVVCLTEESFHAELASLAEFYLVTWPLVVSSETAHAGAGPYFDERPA
jgi:hypothetical protein